MTCPKCGNTVRAHERHCVVCGEDIGYPNVRAASAPQEARALDQRFEAAQRVSQERGCEEVFSRFTAAMRCSKAVLCRSLHQVMQLAASDNELYASFYGQVSAQMRRPEDGVIERERLLADDLLFPHYREQVRYAALTLNDYGPDYYGRCAMVLSEVAIGTRATVFEKNSLEFCKEQKLGPGRPIPFGFRATWQARDKLAGAKLHEKLRPRTSDAEFADMILPGASDGKEADFIEVHIYGPLHRRAIESVSVRGTVDDSDEALLLEIERRLCDCNARVCYLP